MTIGETIREEERVQRILAAQREWHKDPEYRRACLIALFEQGLLAPVNDYKH